MRNGAVMKMIWRYYIRPLFRRRLVDWTQYPLFGISMTGLGLVFALFAIIALLSGMPDPGKELYTLSTVAILISIVLDLPPVVMILLRWVFRLPFRILRYFRNQ